MATDYGTKEKGGIEPEVGEGFGGSDKEPKQTMKKMGKSTNHAEHDEMLHDAMPKGYKGDCGY
jgi:hypothetical protein